MDKFSENKKITGASGQPVRKKKNLKRCWIMIFVIAAILIVLFVLFINLGKFLVVNNTPVKSDVIVVLTGGDERIAHAVTLCKEGYSDKLLLTGCEDKIALMKQYAVESGISADNILEEDKSSSTYENAVFTKDIVLEMGFESAIVVTSDYHTRRSMLVFKKAFRDTGVSFVYCSSDDEGFTPAKWWSNGYSFRLVMSEYVKLAGYFVQGRL